MCVSPRVAISRDLMRTSAGRRVSVMAGLAGGCGRGRMCIQGGRGSCRGRGAAATLSAATAAIPPVAYGRGADCDLVSRIVSMVGRARRRALAFAHAL